MLVAIHQPNYLPRLRVFDKMAAADLWVFLDNVQYVKREWQNRALLQAYGGPHWLTVPVKTKGRFSQKIQDVEIDGPGDWQRVHHRTLRSAYAKAPHLNALEGFLSESYLEQRWTMLSQLNTQTTLALRQILGLQSPIVMASELGVEGSRNELLLDICRKTGASAYLSGTGALAYLEPELFRKERIQVFVLNPPARDETQPEWALFNHSVLHALANFGVQETRALLRGNYYQIP